MYIFAIEIVPHSLLLCNLESALLLAAPPYHHNPSVWLGVVARKIALGSGCIVDGLDDVIGGLVWENKGDEESEEDDEWFDSGLVHK